MSHISSQSTSANKGTKRPTNEDSSPKSGSTENAQADNKWIPLVEEKVRALRFGIVQITIHNGKVVQIDSTERTRMEIEA
jgi:hypothetical protein